MTFRKLFRKPSRKTVFRIIYYACICTALILTGFVAAFYSYIGQNATWDSINSMETDLRNLYSNETQQEMRTKLSVGPMNFTDGLVWESQRLTYTENRPQYTSVSQVLNNGKGACGEFVLVFGAFCIAKNIPFRVVTVGYFFPNIVDHVWAQVNPSHDGRNWIQVEVTDTCARLRNGSTISQLWNDTINSNGYYSNNHYKLVFAYQVNDGGEVVITDVTSTFA